MNCLRWGSGRQAGQAARKAHRCPLPTCRAPGGRGHWCGARWASPAGTRAAPPSAAVPWQRSSPAGGRGWRPRGETKPALSNLWLPREPTHLPPHESVFHITASRSRAKEAFPSPRASSCSCAAAWGPGKPGGGVRHPGGLVQAGCSPWQGAPASPGPSLQTRLPTQVPSSPLRGDARPSPSPACWSGVPSACSQEQCWLRVGRGLATGGGNQFPQDRSLVHPTWDWTATTHCGSGSCRLGIKHAPAV